MKNNMTITVKKLYTDYYKKNKITTEENKHHKSNLSVIDVILSGYKLPLIYALLLKDERLHIFRGAMLLFTIFIYIDSKKFELLPYKIKQIIFNTKVDLFILDNSGENYSKQKQLLNDLFDLY